MTEQGATVIGRTVERETEDGWKELGIVVALSYDPGPNAASAWRLLVLDAENWMTSWNAEDVRVKP